MHKNRFIITFLILSFIILYGSWAISGVGVPSTVGECTAAQVEIYEMTIKKFEVSLDNGANYETVFEGTATLDLARAPGTNTSAGSFFSGMPVSEGTITNTRVTFKSSFTVRGYVTYGGSTYRTTAGTNLVSTTGASGAGNSVCYDPSVGADGTYTDTQSVSIPITSGTNTVKVTFNMTNALGLMEAGPDYMIVPKQVIPTVEKIS